MTDLIPVAELRAELQALADLPDAEVPSPLIPDANHDPIPLDFSVNRRRASINANTAVTNKDGNARSKNRGR